MSKRTYTVLSPVEYDRLYSPGDTIEIEPGEAAQLIDIGAICDPDDPRAAAAGAEPVDEESAGIFDQALDALRAASSGEVREFFRRMSEDPDIAAKLETEVDRQSRLIAGIDELEEGNKDHWAEDGKPDVFALRKVTGLKDASAAERDAAHEEWKKAKGAE